MNVYLAARYSRRIELCAYRDELRAAGYAVTSRWLDGEHQALDDCATDEQAAKFAMDDLRDIMAARILIAFTEKPRSGASRGGRHVEFGIALGMWLAGKPRHRLIVVGPRENVFYTLPNVEHHAYWRGALRRLTADAMEVADVPGEPSPKEQP